MGVFTRTFAVTLCCLAAAAALAGGEVQQGEQRANTQQRAQAPYYPPELEQRYQAMSRSARQPYTNYYQPAKARPWSTCGAFAPNTNDPFRFGPPGGAYDFHTTGMAGWVILGVLVW